MKCLQVCTLTILLVQVAAPASFGSGDLQLSSVVPQADVLPDNSKNNLLAGGPVGKPAPAQPAPASPTSKPPSFTPPAPQPSNIPSPLPAVTPMQGEEITKPTTGPTPPANAPEKVTIEFNEGLAPVSNQPGLSAVEAMNEALRMSPRASAIRSQLAIARAGFALAT